MATKTFDRLCRFLNFVCKLCSLTLLLSSYTTSCMYRVGLAGTQSNGLEERASKALELAQSGNLESAEDELRKVVALEPDNGEFLQELGTVLAMEKKLEESTSFFERALRIEPGDLVARRYLAANLWQLHRFAEARQNLQVLLKAKPGDPQTLLLFGMVSENTADYSTAVKTLTSVPALVRAQPESIAALARSYYHIGEADKARLWLKELLNHPAGTRAVLLGAQIADEMQDYRTAETLLASLPPDLSDQATVKYQLALVKFHANQFAESEKLVQQLLDAGHQSGEIYRLLGWCRQEQRQHQDAVRAFQEAIKLEPTNVTSYLDLGKILLTERRIVPALELTKRTANAFPDSSRVFVLKGSVELAAILFTDAVDSFSRALQLDRSSPDASIGLARAQFGSGMTQQAKATLERAIANFPNKAPFELELAQLLLKEAETGDEGAGTRAEQLLKSALVLDDTLAEAHYQLGELELSRGQAQRALIHLEKAEKLNPTSAKTHFALSRAFRRLGRNEEAAKQAALYDKLKEQETSRAPDAPAESPSRN
jgi:tetratricopeptide (TPR) repeat protein